MYDNQRSNNAVINTLMVLMPHTCWFLHANELLDMYIYCKGQKVTYSLESPAGCWVQPWWEWQHLLISDTPPSSHQWGSPPSLQPGHTNSASITRQADILIQRWWDKSDQSNQSSRILTNIEFCLDSAVSNWLSNHLFCLSIKVDRQYVAILCIICSWLTHIFWKSTNIGLISLHYCCCDVDCAAMTK